LLSVFEKNVFLWDKFYQELRSWIGTPYKSTQLTKGVGVDCLSFVGCCLLKVFKVDFNKQQVLDYILPNQWHIHNSKQLLVTTAVNFLINELKHSFILFLEDDVKSKNLQRGDILFFKIKGYKSSCHVGVYVGDDLYIHSNTSLGVVEEKIRKNLITHILRLI